jgi:ATP-dependent Zn protease
MTNPIAQIDDEVREMTDEEYSEYEQIINDNSGATPIAE